MNNKDKMIVMVNSGAILVMVIALSLSVFYIGILVLIFKFFKFFLTGGEG